MQVNIRRANTTDSERLLKLLSELGRPTPRGKNDRRKFKNLIESYIDSKTLDRSILVATIGSRVIGLVSYFLLDRLNQRLKEFWIPDLVVSEEYRDLGIGKLLIQRCQSIAQRNKCYRIRLESGNERTDAHKFYEKLNFDQSALVFDKSLLKK